MSIDYDLMRSPGALIRRAQQVHAALWSERVGQEFTSAQFAVLTAARRYPDADQTQLSHESSLDTSTVQAVVMRLVSKGLLSRERSVQDRRRWLVRLTVAGMETLDKLLPRVLGIPDLLLCGLGEHERQEFSRMLLTIVEQGESQRRSLAGSDDDLAMAAAI